MSKNKLFVKVNCKAYLAKYHDGVYIQFYSDNGEYLNDRYIKTCKDKAVAIAYNNSGEEIKDLSEFCGESVEKVYRKRVEENFNGVVVGYTSIKVKGIIGTDWYDNTYTEYGHCFKKTTEKVACAVVFFKNNCKRYVPLNDLEVIDSIA